MPNKPRELYDQKWFLSFYYDNYQVTDNLLKIPNTFINFSNPTRDLTNEDELRQTVMEIFRDHWEDIDENIPDEFINRDINIYVLEWPEKDEKYTEFEDMISGFKEGDTIDEDQYSAIIHYLPQQKLITFKIER